MMAFFITMPTSRMQPMVVISVNSMLTMRIASNAPKIAGGSVVRMVNGWA